jgi:hypothetical protein
LRPGTDVPLEEELRHIEGVDDVRAVQEEMRGLARGERQAAVRALRRSHGEERLRVELRVRGEVVERPLELARDRADLEVRLGGRRIDRVQGLPRHDEQDDDDDRRHERPGDLGEIVAVRLRRELVVTWLASVADDRPDDQALDDEEDHDREAEDDVVEVANVLALDALRGRREEAVPDRRRVQDHQDDDADRDDGGDEPADDRHGRRPAAWGGRHRRSSNAVGAPNPDRARRWWKRTRPVGGLGCSQS